MANAQGIRAGRAYVELGVAADKLNKGLKTASSTLSGWASDAQSRLASAFVVAAPVALAVKTFADFDDQMRLTQAVTGATGAEFDALTKKAKELGATTSWTAAQVASGMVGLGRAGFKTSEIDDSIESVMALARATGTEIDVATDIAGAALRSFSMDASEMRRVCDVLSATANGSAQTLEDLGEAFKYVAPIAAQTGLTIEATAKIVGSLANFGVKGSQAGTVFKNIQTRMATDDNARAAYASLGIDTTDAEGNLRKVGDVIAELGQKIAALPNAEKLSIIKTVFGQYGITGVAITAASFDDLNQAIDNASGAAKKTAEQMDAGLGGAMRITQSAVEGFGIALGESLVPFLSEAAAKIQETSGKLKSFSETNGSTITTCAKLATAFIAANAGLLVFSKTAGAVVSIGRAATTTYSALVKTIDFLVGASRAAAAAEAAHAATTKANTAANTSATAVLTAKTTAERTAAEAEFALSVAQARAAAAAEADAAAKAAATASTVAMTAAMTAAVAVVAAVAFGLYKYANAADKAAEKAKDAADEARRLSDENAQTRELDSGLFEQLTELASKQSLTNEEFAKAQNIVAELQSRYGELGLACDATSKSILGMTNAQERFNQAKRDQELADIQNELAQKKREQDALKRTQEKFGYKTAERTLSSAVKEAGSLFGGESWEEGRIRNKNELANVGAEIASLERRLAAAQNLNAAAQQDALMNRAAETISDANESAIEKALTSAYNSESSNVVPEIETALEPVVEDTVDAAEASAEETVATSDVTSNALEALDWSNEWQKDLMKKQTDEIAKQTDAVQGVFRLFEEFVGNYDAALV